MFKECFSPRLSSKSPHPQRDETLKKRERKSIEKKREKEKKSSKSLFK
jgi:hypothetical protein